MAGELSSYDKVDHLKTHFSDWEALSIHEADPTYSEYSSFQSDSEDNDGPRPLSRSKGRSSGLGGHRDLKASRRDSQHPGSGANQPSANGRYAVQKLDGDESGVTKKHQAMELPQGYSQPGTSGSTISSAIESLTRPRTPLSPTNQADTPKPVVRFTDRALAKRPAVSRRSSANAVPTAAEWGVLFDGKGYATVRNGQFLKGLARHVIDDLAPGSSNLVVTPDKLSVLYSKYRLDSEIYPFLEIFTSRARDAHERLADFFTDLDCQYHLVQPDSYSRPRVPALTPIGFAQFLTTCILAHPDEEFRRLNKIVSDVQLMADGEQERFPRQLLRSQFPVRHDPKSRKVLAAALDDLIYDLRLLELPSPKKPLAIMPPPSSERRSEMLIPGVRHYIPSEKTYARKDAYVLPASSRQNLPSALKTAGGERSSVSHLDNKDRDRDRDRYDEQARTRYTEEPESYEPTSPTAVRDQQYRSAPASPTNFSIPPARPAAVTRTSQTGPLTTTARTVHVCSYPNATPAGSSTSIYRPTGTSTPNTSSTTTYRRAQSPPSRAYRASAPDVSGNGSSTNYYKPAGYLPAPGNRREPAVNPASASTSSGSVVDTSYKNAHSRRASSGGVIEGGPSMAMTVRGNASNSGSSTSKAPTAPPTPTPTPTSTALTLPPSSPSSPSATPSTNRPPHPHIHQRSHSHQDIPSHRRTATAPLPLPLPLLPLSPLSTISTISTTSPLNTGDKKQQHNSQHQHHRRRRSAIVTMGEDKGPTWEEVLKAQPSPSHHHRSGSSGNSGNSGNSKGSHHHHHRHHSGY
ncbi:hypothetical protein F5Y06DRAFT_302640 [Hypoxylon sp. FL0890]|nr:hypothetical protein F5Y06DRAFT_302640 [Hypoxylon sp. FL0890]